jgi:hypothetical protein
MVAFKCREIVFRGPRRVQQTEAMLTHGSKYKFWVFFDQFEKESVGMQSDQTVRR